MTCDDAYTLGVAHGMFRVLNLMATVGLAALFVWWRWRWGP